MKNIKCVAQQKSQSIFLRSPRSYKKKLAAKIMLIGGHSPKIQIQAV